VISSAAAAVLDRRASKPSMKVMIRVVFLMTLMPLISAASLPDVHITQFAAESDPKSTGLSASKGTDGVSSSTSDWVNGMGPLCNHELQTESAMSDDLLTERSIVTLLEMSAGPDESVTVLEKTLNARIIGAKQNLEKQRKAEDVAKSEMHQAQQALVVQEGKLEGANQTANKALVTKAKEHSKGTEINLKEHHDAVKKASVKLAEAEQALKQSKLEQSKQKPEVTNTQNPIQSAIDSQSEGTSQTTTVLKHIVLKNLSVKTHTVLAQELHASVALKTTHLQVAGNLNVNSKFSVFHGAVHLSGQGENLSSGKSSVSLKAALIVNKSNQKGSGLALSNKGGFFDHHDGYVTYESLEKGKGFNVNAEMRISSVLHVDGSIKLGGKGILRKSSVTGRDVYTNLHTNQDNNYATGFAVSDAGGWFDFKDDYITYEPLSGKKGLKVNSKLRIQGLAEFNSDVSIEGTLSVANDINVGGSNMLSFSSFSDQHKQHKVDHETLLHRVSRLESTNKQLQKRLEQFETAMLESKS